MPSLLQVTIWPPLEMAIVLSGGVLTWLQLASMLTPIAGVTALGITGSPDPPRKLATLAGHLACLMASTSGSRGLAGLIRLTRFAQRVVLMSIRASPFKVAAITGER